jgi:hypothetical protein
VSLGSALKLKAAKLESRSPGTPISCQVSPIAEPYCIRPVWRNDHGARPGQA